MNHNYHHLVGRLGTKMNKRIDRGEEERLQKFAGVARKSEGEISVAKREQR